MLTVNKNNFIAIAKAIGIILMVIGHSGCPFIIRYFLYTFHMPLFFLCSGYFFKEISDGESLRYFVKRKIKGLYFPYIKWSILFLLLHNIFCILNIYNSITHSHPYNCTDFFHQLIKAVIMSDYELLIRPFWFVKELLLASLCVAFISLIRKRFFNNINEIQLLFLFLILTGLSKQLPYNPLTENLSILLFSIVYFYSGIVLKQYKQHLSISYSLQIGTFIIVLIGSILFNRVIDMRYTTMMNYIPYFIISICGIVMTFITSELLERTTLKPWLYYIGNHTMPILALNLLALKLGNLIKIWIYGMPIEMLSSHPIIKEHNNYFWLLYTFIGIGIPLLFHYLYNRCYIKIKIYLDIKN